MKQYVIRLLSMLALLLSYGVVAAKKTKKLDKALVACAMTVCNNAKVCGTINCVTFPFAYGSFINATNNFVVLTGEDIPFTHDTIPPRGMTHSASPFTSITLEQTGIYFVLYKVRTSGMSNLATVQVYQNGTPVFGTSDTGVTAVLSAVLIAGTSGDRITLRNVGLPQTLVSSNAASPSALLVLKRVA